MRYVTTVFSIPVIDEKIWLAQRNTPPRKGEWGGVGGKTEHPNGDNPWNQPGLVEKVGGHQVIKLTDRAQEENGHEYLQGGAIREFCEEMFSNRTFPYDFRQEDFTDIYKLGGVYDRINWKGEEIETENNFFIFKVNRKDFFPSPREISGFKPLEEITAEQIFPLTKLALAHIHFMYKFWKLESPYGKIADQIEPLLQENFISRPDVRFSDGEHRLAGLSGVLTYYKEACFGEPERDSIVLEHLKAMRNPNK